MTVLMNSVNNPQMAHQVEVTERTMGKSINSGALKPCLVPADTYVVLRDEPGFKGFLEQSLIWVSNGIDTYLLRVGDKKINLQRVDDREEMKHPLEGRDPEGEIVRLLESYGLGRSQIQPVIDIAREWVQYSDPWAG